MDYIVGDTVSALVTALTKAKNGKRVALYIPESGAGGGFSGLQVRGRTLDFGIRALELAFVESDKEKSRALDSFEPGLSDHKDYISHIRAFVTGIAGNNIAQIAPPEIYRNGCKTQCIFFTPDLSVLRTLFDADEQAVIAREAQALADHPLKTSFGRQYLTQGLSCLRDMRLEEVLLASHGACLYQKLYAPLAEKMLNPVRYPQGLRDVPAEFYRKFWFKLFYPENIAAACSGGDALRLYRPFHYPKIGGFKGFMDELARQAVTHPNVQLTSYKKIIRIAAEGRNCTVTFEGSPPVSMPQENLTVCVSPSLLFKATGIAYEQSSIEWGIVWVEVDRKDVLSVPGILTVVDADIPAFRISSGGTTVNDRVALFTIEFANTDIGDAHLESARQALERTGLIREGCAIEEIHYFRGKSLPDFRFSMLESYNKAKENLSAKGLDKVMFTGAMHSLHSDAFNDHVIQGLYYGSR